MEIFKNDKIEKIFESSIYISIGLILIIFSFLDRQSFSYTLAGFLLIVSIFNIFSFFWTIKDNNQSYLTKGILLGFLVVLIILFNNIFFQIIFVIASIFILYHAITNISFTIDMKTINEPHWILDLIYSTFLFLSGGALLVLDAINGIPFNIILIICGSIFTIDSITKILMLSVVHPNYNVKSKSKK